MKIISLLILSYLIGSIPFGFLVAYFVKGIDIRKFGSGNIGATNVFRVVGKKWGIGVFILDFLKGFLPLFLVKFLISDSGVMHLAAVLVTIAVVCGHNWTIFLKFKGGKGVATSLGAIVGMSLIFPKLWFVLLLSLCVWIFIFLLSRYVSLASMVAAAAFLTFSFSFSLSGEVKILAFFLCIFILIRHKKNIKRLLSKNENRF